jgi:restriction system protein
MARRDMWEIEIQHEELNKYRHIRGTDRNVVEQKAAAQKRTWDEMWEKRQEVEQKKREREAAMRDKEEKKRLAVERTNEALTAIESIEDTLHHTLTIDDAIDWNILLDKSDYPEKMPEKPDVVNPPPEPKESDKKYISRLGFYNAIFSKSKAKKLEAAHKLFHADHSEWVKEKESAEQRNKELTKEYKRKLQEWQSNKDKFKIKQKEKNNKILMRKQEYLDKEPDAISDYYEMVLSNSQYPDLFPQEYDLEYNAETKLLVVDYSLPAKEHLPSSKTVKYVISRDEFTETKLSGAALNKLYDNLLYQIALRSIHELYEADVIHVIDSIVLNGWVNSVDKATGQEVNACILSVQASKDEFLAINLEKVDPKSCFKKFKGVGSSKLHGLSPVAPIIQIDRRDTRFVSPYDVVDSVDVRTNLAAMDWQDFENLIREIFEKEFTSTGGEVKVTQASRDGGVDAIAFDPDPIRGGKIVIQAKRYTNVVGVSAVRDLYGTVVNEGATKGVLVTTADYGTDAYAFAKGKPLTLLNGNNLLHLLEKHGHKAKIDLKEAKKILAEQND